MEEAVRIKVLPYWAAAAFVARCARRYSDLYVRDTAEPESARAAVREAVRLGEIKAALGGIPRLWDEAVEFDGQYFDNYDVDALAGALGHYAEAAENTRADLDACSTAGPLSRRNLAAILLARQALVATFFGDLKPDRRPDPAAAIELVQMGDPDEVPYAELDLIVVQRLAVLQEWSDLEGVAPEIFGPLFHST